MKPASISPPADARDPEAVRAMFGRIAQRYDLANHLLSGGADFLWRRRAARIVEAWQPRRVLDLATGSGDLALAVQRRLPEAAITATDFSPEMLSVARRKGVRETVLADALRLPFEAESFDCVTVAFGLRNMSDWNLALREMARVLSPGGHLLVLDFSLPAGALRPAYRFYLHRCLPGLASIVTGQKTAYDYLGGSIEKFPSGNEMLSLIEKNGFAMASAQPLTGGIATIYTARKA
ncbi:MAG TPA: bifunctional demethylmenaquinone methyltransferase/2-methoxy-6-polyprenyl-1,4-benzoquinol methylase UbiE [Chthoniobacterales bacterium]|nr:bifunctional demethylmenaquinone methyltransferase/2-methoxy-6-polyprenyl-1,4-benzoquinol methylase UbiE [Chthoniobacterales bacterium]